MASVEKGWNHGIHNGHGIRSVTEQRKNKREERLAVRELRHILIFGEPSPAFYPVKKRKLAKPKPEHIAARIEEQDLRYMELESKGRLTPPWLEYGRHHKERIMAKMRQIRNRDRGLRPSSEPSLS